MPGCGPRRPAGRTALYPDDLLAIILPAATFPLDVVQADRFLQIGVLDFTNPGRTGSQLRLILNYGFNLL